VVKQFIARRKALDITVISIRIVNVTVSVIVIFVAVIDLDDFLAKCLVRNILLPVLLLLLFLHHQAAWADVFFMRGW
jgi:hypothetical protein